MAALAHSLGILVIAEGVKTDAERHIVLDIRLDGATGPGVRYFLPIGIYNQNTNQVGAQILRD